MKRMIRLSSGLCALALLIVVLRTDVAEAQVVSLLIDKVVDVDTLKVAVKVKQTGMAPNPDVIPGSGFMISGTIDLEYDPTALHYKYTDHPIVAGNPVYDSFPRETTLLQTKYGPPEAGTVAITPSRVPSVDSLNLFPDFCNPATGACSEAFVRITMADPSLADAWQFFANTYQTILTHHFQILPANEAQSDVSQKAAVDLLDVLVDSTTLAICFVDGIAAKTAQCCKGDAAEQEVAGFCIIESPVLLPVELVEFAAAVVSGDVVLEWSTASETNNAGFSVEHAIDEGAFEEIAFVDGAGSSLEPRTYTHTVKGLDVGTHRFRLKQLDYDGSFAYSSVVQTSIELAGTHRLGAAYPNPFNPSTTFELVVGREQHVKIDVINALGQRVHRLFDGSIEANKPTNFTFEAGSLPTGLYFYRVVGENFAQTRQALLVK